MKSIFLSIFALFGSLDAHIITEKILICGIAKNVEEAVPNTIRSAEQLGSQFIDYQVIIYENNSEDNTKQLFGTWAEKNPKVMFISENITHEELTIESHMKRENRTESIARARNIVLQQAMADRFNDFKYIIMADLDFAWYPWDVENIVDTIMHPEHEWDAVFANGYYDEFALRTKDLPVGYELAGHQYWWSHEQIRTSTVKYFGQRDHWEPVYSAFGGLAIYKRDSLQGSSYSGVVTKDLEKLASHWLQEAYKKENVPLLKNYEELLKTLPIYSISDDHISNRNDYPRHMGVRLYNEFGEGSVVWFSCEDDATLPWTCEHIPLHASMILKGHDKLFINPRLISTIAGPP